MKSVDPYLDRRWRRGEYTCLDHASEVWAALTGEPLHEDVRAFLERRTLGRAARLRIRRLPGPVDPCVVLFRNAAGSHLGVYLRGRVLHLSERAGAQFVPLHVARISFTSVKFYVQSPAAC